MTFFPTRSNPMTSRRPQAITLLTFAGVLLTLSSPIVAQTKATPLPQVNANAKGQYVAVLMWHDVVKETKEVWFDTTVKELKTQFEAIKRRKFNVIPMDTLLRSLTEGTPLPPRPLVLTFDDNNQGLYDNAFPLLKQYGFPATLFVHTNYIGVLTSKAHCDWPTLLAMQKSGLITIQGHTCSHPADMRLLSDAENNKELRDSKALIEKHTGRPCYAFAYPEGHFDDHVARLTVASGYKLAFTENWGSASSSRNLMLVNRYSIHKRFAQSLKDVEAAWRTNGVKKR